MKLIISCVEPPGCFLKLWHNNTGWFRKHDVFWLQNVNKKLYESKQKVLYFRGAFLTFCLQSKTTTLMRFSWEMFWFYLTILMFVHSFVRYAFSWPCINITMNEWKRPGHRMEVWKFLPSDLKWVKWFVWLLWCARICFIGCRQPTSFHLNLTATSKITKLSALLCSVFYYMQSVTPAKSFDVVYIS